jgi:hypothetical protein
MASTNLTLSGTAYPGNRDDKKLSNSFADSADTFGTTLSHKLPL